MAVEGSLVPERSGRPALLGGLLLGVIPDLVLIPALSLVLLISAVKVARH